MAKPQQPELRRSGFVPALDPDASESELAAHERPTTKGRTGPVPEEQRPGHHPEHEQDKPDLDKFAARLGIVADGDEPDDAPRVEEDTTAEEASTVTRLEDAPSKQQARQQAAARSEPAAPRRTWSPIGLALVGPVTGVLIARRIIRVVTRR